MLAGVLCAAIVLNVAVAVPTTPQPIQTTTPNPVPTGQCTRTVSGMTTCTILNAATVQDDSSLSFLEKAVDVAYNKSVAGKDFKDTCFQDRVNNLLNRTDVGLPVQQDRELKCRRIRNYSMSMSI